MKSDDEPPQLPTLHVQEEMDTEDVVTVLSDQSSDSEVKTLKSHTEHPPAKKRKSAFSDLFGEVFITDVEPAKSLEFRVDKEITNYKAENGISLESDPLDWWKHNETKYPLLSNLAKKYLCIPATSVASERIFSTAGDIVTAQRSCLSSDQVDRLIFLKKNYTFA